MTGFFGLAQTARVAHARIRAAEELASRFEQLPPEQKAEAQAEWDRLRAAVRGVRRRMTYGATGFVAEFNAARRGEAPPDLGEPEPLIALVKELTRATSALRRRLDAIDDEQPKLT